MADDTASFPSNYPSNSKSKGVQDDVKSDKKVEKVIQGEATQRKKSLGHRIASSFAGEDVHSVGSYVLFDVMLPTLKTLIADMASQSVERFLFGENARGRSTGLRTPGGSINYNRISTPIRSVQSAPWEAQRPRAGVRIEQQDTAYNEIVVATRGEAEVVLDSLQALLEKYGLATVADLKGLVGITGSYIDEKWGWSDLRRAGIRHVNGGFLIDMPRAEGID